jgi:hypothetical protein
MRWIFNNAIGIALLVSASRVGAQSVQEEVMQAVVGLFNGMREADSVAVLRSFHPAAILQTIVNHDDGTPVVHTQSLAGFATSVGRQAPGALDERIMFDMVRVEGDLASVWTPYLFNYNGSLSHCGVNSFQLVKTGGEWKIRYLIDTRKVTDCGPSHLYK